MTVVVNGSEREVAEQATLAEVVAAVTRSATGVAVAVGDTVVPRADWASTVLGAGDRVEVLTAVPGG